MQGRAGTSDAVSRHNTTLTDIASSVAWGILENPASRRSGNRTRATATMYGETWRAYGSSDLVLESLSTKGPARDLPARNPLNQPRDSVQSLAPRSRAEHSLSVNSMALAVRGFNLAARMACTQLGSDVMALPGKEL